jgi:hypothetical protein
MNQIANVVIFQEARTALPSHMIRTHDSYICFVIKYHMLYDAHLKNKLYSIICAHLIYQSIDSSKNLKFSLYILCTYYKICFLRLYTRF